MTHSLSSSTSLSHRADPLHRGATATLALVFSLVLSLVLAVSGCGLVKFQKSFTTSTSSSASSSSSAGGESAQREAGSLQPGQRTATPPQSCFARGGSSGTVAELAELIETRSLSQAAADLTNALCTTDGDIGAHQDQVRRVRAAWMARHHLDERDVAYLDRRNTGRVGGAFQDLETFAGPVGEYGVIWKERGDRMLAVDRLGAKTSTLARVALALDCFSLASETYQTLSAYPLGKAILCTREPLSLEKAFAEIDQPVGEAVELNEQSRHDLRQAAVRAVAAVTQARAELAKLAKEEPGVAALIAIADAEFLRWSRPAPLRSKLLAQLDKLEAAAKSTKRSALQGCGDQTLAAWLDVVGAAKLPSVPERVVVSTYADVALATAEGSLAYAALRLCAARSYRIGDTLADLPRYWLRRGPRSATIASWASQEVEFDDVQLSMRAVLEPWISTTAPNIDSTPVVSGVIASVEKAGDSATISFVTIKEKQVGCIRDRKTNRVRRIGDGGYIEYEHECVARGTVVVDRTPSSVSTAALLAAGLTPGMFLYATADLPLVATSSRSSKRPVFVLGASLR
jgi:hypothetical protein